MFEITSNVPDVFQAEKKKRGVGMPILQLEVGQGFFVPKGAIKEPTVRMAASRNSRDGRQFSVAKVDDGMWVKRTA